MTDDIERTEPAPEQPSAETPAPRPTAPAWTGFIKRASAPATADGTRWEVQLSAVPSSPWLEFFKEAEGASPSASGASPRPRRVTFDQASIVFKSDEDHVERWIEAIDKWIAWADRRYIANLEEESRQRSLRLDDAANKRERIVRLNDRFRDL
jgi:hypothetical protein